MSQVPNSGALSFEGMVREFRSSRGITYGTYNVYDLEQRIAADGVAGNYGSQSAGSYWAMGGMFGKYRHYFTWGGNKTFAGSGATTGTLSRFTTLHDGYMDDGFITVNLPFPFYMQGTAYYTAYVGSNGYITFSSGASVYSGLSWSNPPYPKIMFGSGDRNMTYCGVAYHTGYDGTQGNIAVTIRVETNSIYTSNQTRGTANSVIEVTFINPENCVNRNFIGLGMDFGNFTDYGNNLYGLGTASGAVLAWSNSPNTSYGVYGATNGYWSGNQPGNYWGPYPTGTD